MGRYAQFSTGASYKFWFAIQNSQDILEFGGLSRNNRGYELGMIQWSHKLDYEYILSELALLTDDKDVDEILSQQPSNLDGTNELYSQLQNLQTHLNETIRAKISLGLFIAHQLKQEPDLTAEYEIV